MTLGDDNHITFLAVDFYNEPKGNWTNRDGTI